MHSDWPVHTTSANHSAPAGECGRRDRVALGQDPDLPGTPADGALTRRSQRLERAARYLRERYAEEVSLGELADLVGVTRYHFLRLFSNSFGVTPHRYQLLLRVGHAKTLLRHGLAIADVALRVGFCDQSHLTRSFHRVVGVAPGQYQSGRFQTDARSRQQGATLFKTSRAASRQNREAELFLTRTTKVSRRASLSNPTDLGLQLPDRS